MERTRESEDTLHTGLWSRLSMCRRRSVTSAESSNNGDEGSEKQEEREYFPATRLFEYHWPLGEEQSEHYMLQEQVAEYLDIRGIQRKYPDLQRRSLELEERKYLVGRGVVTETQSNMGLVALRSEEVLELMVDEYPRKYEEYMDVVQEREFQAALQQKIMETKRVALMGGHAGVCPRNHQTITSEALRLTVEYNTRLAEQRRTLRKEYFDSQTRILQIPRKYPRVEEPSESSGYPSRYPVALLPNQYSDYYRKYSAEEMRTLPVRTVLELPPKTSDGITAEALPTSVAQQSSNPEPCDTVQSRPLPSKGSPSISTESIIQEQSGKPEPSTSSVGIPTPTSMKQTTQPKTLNLRLALCTVCYKGRAANKFGEPEELIQCANCSRTIHPSCYDMSKTAGDVAKTYAWQCLECKTCQVCGDPDEEDKMVCCDQCDRGYHSFCVGLTSIPSGQWLCKVCGSCSSCGSKSAGSDPNSKWKHEYACGKFLQTLCVRCSKHFRMGHFCPVCLKVYHNDKSDSPMVCCDECDRWIHTECDDISKERYQQLSEEKLSYICCLCRGEVNEKLNTFHKKYRSIG